MFLCNLCHAIINALKVFAILNLPYVIAKKVKYGQYGQNPNLSYRALLLLYWYSSDNPTNLHLVHIQQKGGMGKHNSKG